MSTSGKKNVTLNKKFGINNDIKGIYAVQVIEFVDGGVKDFITEVYRYENADDLEGTRIGKYSTNGTLEIFDGNDIEQQYISTLDREMTRSAVSMIPSQFSDMSADERIRFNLRTGNRNVDEVALTIQEQRASGLTASGDIAEVDLAVEDTGYNSYVRGEQIEANPELLGEGGSGEGYTKVVDVEIKGRNARTEYGNYCYPEAMRNSKQDRIKFTMKYSKGSRIETTTTSGIDIFQRREKAIKGSVTLPIQSGIKDQNSVKWNGASLNALQAFGAGAAMRIFDRTGGGDPIESLATEADDIRRSAIGAFRGAAGSDNLTAINVYLAQQAVGTQRLLSRTAGAIVNPNVEMLFDAPSLRPFSFQFRMSPRDEDEAAEVKSIIAFFKQGMSVKTSSSNVFLKAPNIFDIRYITYKGDTAVDHPSINRIKTCALLAASVDYTPDNTYMTYDDPERTMTSYGLTLSFNELDPIYEDDYTEELGMTNSSGPTTKIGY